MPVYTVQGLVGRHAGVVGRGRRDQSPFVGRARELALLDDHLAAAMAGQGQVVGLVGEPGMGKTRLLAEFCRRVPGDQVTVYAGQCLSYGQSTPYLPVRDLVQQVCGLVEGDTAAVHTAAVQHRLHASGITAEDDVALLLQLLDLPVAPEALARRSPEGRQARTFALLRHLILDAAQQQPLVLVVENLHWSDPTSAAWLASLVERLAGAAVLLLGTYRPGYQPAWGAHAAVTQVVVPPLRAQESRTVVQAVLGAVALPEARLRALVAQAGGNPFFLEELAWHAREQGAPDTPGAVPETVHAVLAARMDRLSSEAKHLLQVAAVVGPEVSLPLLQVTAELSEEALHRGLAQLQAAEFLYETRLFPDHAYTFKHALTHEVAYSSLLQERRRPCMRGLSRPLRGSPGTGWPSRWNAWPTTPCGARCGTRPWRTAGRRGRRPWSGRPTVRPWGTSSRPSAPCRICRRRVTCASRPSICGFALRNALLVRLATTNGMLDIPARGRGPCGSPRRRASAWDTSLLFWWHPFLRMGAYDQAITAAQRALRSPRPSGMASCRRERDHSWASTYYAQGDYQRAIDCFGQHRGVPRRRTEPRTLRALRLPCRASPSLARRVPCRTRSLCRGQGAREPRGSGLPRRSIILQPDVWRITVGAVCCPSARATCPGRFPCSNGPCISARTRASRSFPALAAGLGVAYTLADALPTPCRCSSRRWSSPPCTGR